MFNEHYINWRDSRINGIKKYISTGYFKEKTLLEVGCGYADIGNIFCKLGAVVTSCDARQEHLEMVNKKYPKITTFKYDADKDKIKEKYDIIIHWGLLYHLKEIKKHLKDISKNCDVLLLETEVSDSDDPKFYISVDENGYDQSFNNKGIRPSQSYIETLLKKYDFEFKLIKDPILNAEFHVYDWEITNSCMWRHGLRRYWICWKKDIPSPLK